jgi:molybdenum cofactor biosynthesis protein A
MDGPMLIDNHGRRINYLRLAVTDRCNLRCFYCMPADGIAFSHRKEILSYEEMLRLVSILSKIGIDKVRITGGEPFVRRDIMKLLRGIAETPGIQTLTLTTNGTLTTPFIPELKALGVRSVNLSLDSLDPSRFAVITRRDSFREVWECLEALLRNDIRVKINTVVMAGCNDADILPLAQLTRDLPVDVRFIEEMPFNGSGIDQTHPGWHWKRILEHLQNHFQGMEPIPTGPGATAYEYKIPGHLGQVGIIAAYSRTFCGTCNRLRIGSQGVLKTCLYDSGIFSLRDLMRAGASDEQIAMAVLDAVGNRWRDGHEAEKNRFAGLPIGESMTTIGG